MIYVSDFDKKKYNRFLYLFACLNNNLKLQFEWYVFNIDFFIYLLTFEPKYFQIDKKIFNSKTPEQNKSIVITIRQTLILDHFLKKDIPRSGSSMVESILLYIITILKRKRRYFGWIKMQFQIEQSTVLFKNVKMKGDQEMQ